MNLPKCPKCHDKGIVEDGENKRCFLCGYYRLGELPVAMPLDSQSWRSLSNVSRTTIADKKCKCGRAKVHTAEVCRACHDEKRKKKVHENSRWMGIRGDA